MDVATRPVRITALACLLAAAAVVAGCGSDDDSGESSRAPSTSPTSAATSQADAANADLEAAYKGTYAEPPSEPNPAAKGKRVAILACGLSSPTVAAIVKGLQSATKDLGWTAKVFDAKLDPSNFPKGFTQAIADKQDGIIAVCMDAPLVKSALQQAAQAKIPTIPVQGWDMDQIEPGEKALYTTRISFGDRHPDFADAMRAYGEDSAAYAIARAGGKGTILNFTNPEFATLKFIQEGFAKKVKESCPDCELKDVSWLAKDFGPALTAKAKAALLQNPDVKAIHGNTNPQLGITQAVVQSRLADKVPVVGGFGLSIDFDVVREKKGLTAVNSWPSEWWSYAAADTLNSVFNGAEPRDQGMGWALVDAEHGMPAKGQDWKPPIDVPAAYRKSWEG